MEPELDGAVDGTPIAIVTGEALEVDSVGAAAEDDISWWRKYTRVGDEYQASTLPVCTPAAPQPGDTSSNLTWEPSNVPSERTLTDFLDSCEPHAPFRGAQWLKSTKGAIKAAPKTSKKRPRDEAPAAEVEAEAEAEAVAPPAKNPWLPQVAYDALHDGSYDVSTASTTVRAFSDARHWTDEERAAFSRAISVHGKDFKRVALIVGTRTLKQTIEYFFTWWRCSPEHAVWKKTRDSRRGAKGKTTGIPRNADIVASVRGRVFDEEGKVKISCSFSGAADTVVYEYQAPAAEPAACSTPGGKALTDATSPRTGPATAATPAPAAPQPTATVGATGGFQPASWPPSGTYIGHVSHNGEQVAETIKITFTQDLLVSGTGSSSLIGKLGIQVRATEQAVFVRQVVQAKIVLTSSDVHAKSADLTGQKWYLTGQRTSTNLRDLYYIHLWPHLVASGWRVEIGNRPNDLYFLPPDVPTRLSKKHKCRKHYFDSRKGVLAFVKSNPTWRPQNEKYHRAMCGEETADVERNAYTAVLRRAVAKQQLDQQIAELPPSPGGHDSFCNKCHDVGELLVCDGCPLAYHLQCLEPPVANVEDLPDGDWFCPQCTAKETGGANATLQCEGITPATMEQSAVLPSKPEASADCCIPPSLAVPSNDSPVQMLD